MLAVANPIITQEMVEAAAVNTIRLATYEVGEPRVSCDLCHKWCYPITITVMHPRWSEQPKKIHTHTCLGCLRAYAQVLAAVPLEPGGETRW